jgi:hypothetical protein
MNPVRFERMVEEGMRKYDYYSDNPYIKLCGICANVCIFCEKGILQTQTSGYGCCYLCLMNVPTNIERMQGKKRADICLQITRLEREIATIHAGNAFRGFFDFAIEYYLRQQILINNARLKQQEIENKERKLQHDLQIEADKKIQEEREKKYEMNRILDEVKNKTLADNILQANYNQWVILQSDNLKKRKERDEQSHQRWIRARSDLQNKHKVA